MFGHASRAHACNESGICVQRNSCLLSVLIETAELDLPELNEEPSDLHLQGKDMFHLQSPITSNQGTILVMANHGLCSQVHSLIKALIDDLSILF